MKKPLIIVLILVGGLALLGLNYALMAGVFFGPSQEVKAALQSDDAVEVSNLNDGAWLVFNPAQGSPKAGLVIYPEGYQDIRTYAPLSRRLAEAGYLVALISRREKFPFTLAEEDQNVSALMASLPQVPTWFIGGHTWGANLAAYFAKSHPDQVAGVVLWGGRLEPASSLAGSKLPVLMIYGTRDDENENLVAGIRPFLPPQTEWVAIEGGNRVNFANFGPMSRDVGAAIPAAQQQAQAAAATLQFMETVTGP